MGVNDFPFYGMPLENKDITKKTSLSKVPQHAIYVPRDQDENTLLIDDIGYSAEMISKETLTNGWAFQPSSNDIFVAAFPKSGMTWMIQLVHEVMTRGKGLQLDQNIDDIH